MGEMHTGGLVLPVSCAPGGSVGACTWCLGAPGAWMRVPGTHRRV